MTYHSIFVHLDTSNRALIRLDVAVRLAVAHQCRLVGLFVGFAPDPRWFYLMDNAAQYLEADRARRNEAREQVRAKFEAAVKHLSIDVEWRATEGEPVTMALREVREAGLVVAGQYGANDPDSYVAPQFLESLVLESGRPILVIPCAGTFGALGPRTMVAWDGGREAARALHDAIPLLAGGQVCVLHANSATMALRTDASPVAAAVRLLEGQGAEVVVEHAPGGTDLAIGELILSRAANFDASLVVMGAYGHGRFRELVLGGVTRTLLASMTVPVLMTH